jgi:hypothetical protein
MPQTRAKGIAVEFAFIENPAHPRALNNKSSGEISFRNDFLRLGKGGRDIKAETLCSTVRLIRQYIARIFLDD